MIKLILIILFILTNQIVLSQTSAKRSLVPDGEVKLHTKEQVMMLIELKKQLDAPEAETRATALSIVATAKLRLSDARVEQLLLDPSLEIRQFMSSCTFLSEQQIHTLIKTKDPDTLLKLVARNDMSPLQPDVIVDLIAANVSVIDQALASRKSIQLSPKNINILLSRKDPATCLLLAQKYGVGSMGDETAALLKSGSSDAINAAIGRMTEVPETVVNTILAESPLPVRQHLLMQGRFMPTQSQIDIILKDSDGEVKIGLLRRRNIDLPANVVNSGMFDPNDNVSFWFQQRKEFHPTPEQIEIGLNNQRILIPKVSAFKNAEKISISL